MLEDDTCQTIAVDSTKQVLPRTIACRPLSQWESLTPQAIPEIKASPKPKTNKAVAHSGNIDTTRFQRFIGRLERAGPQIILSHLKEDSQRPPGREDDEESVLERQLWLLTGYQMLNVGKAQFTPKPRCDTGRILELYGNLCKSK